MFRILTFINPFFLNAGFLAWWTSNWTYPVFLFFILIILAVVRRYELNRILMRNEENRIKKFNNDRTTFYTDLTHQFRNPLTVILGMVKEIENKPVEAPKIIERNANQILLLINQLLELSQLESGKMTLKLVQSDIVPHLRYLTDSFHSYAESKNIQLLFYPETNSLIMDYDEEKLYHIVSNLLSNAIKFTPENGKIIMHLNTRLKEGKEEMILKVKDNGIGLPTSELTHIFDRFFQVEDSSERKRGSSGVGLALTKKLVLLMNGNISVKSELGKGAEFIIVIPVSREASLQPNGKSLFNEDHSHPDESNLVNVGNTKIIANGEHSDSNGLPLLLIIEDYPDLVTYIQNCLEGQYRFEKAISGPEGINKAIEMVPDIIISDVMIPFKNGFEVCETLKKDVRTSHIPIVLLTAKSTSEDKISGLQKGADAYLTKPFDRTELSIRLKNLIELRKLLSNRYGDPTLFETTQLSQDTIDAEAAFIEKMEGIVEKHLLNGDFSIPEFCRDAGMSRTQLHRKLKALTNKSATHFVRSYRLQKAKELLQTTEFNISEIAYKTGFKSPAYFSTSFFEEFGISPSGTRE